VSRLSLNQFFPKLKYDPGNNRTVPPEGGMDRVQISLRGDQSRSTDIGQYPYMVSMIIMVSRLTLIHCSSLQTSKMMLVVLFKTVNPNVNHLLRR
jgi:hypothetical protein